MFGFDSVYEVLSQLRRLGEALRDAGGDVDVQGVALLDARPLAAQGDVGPVSVAMCCM